MLIYILTLLIPSSFYGLNLKLDNKFYYFLIYLFLFYLIFFIGLRHHTGGDWSAQIYEYYRAQVSFNIYTLDFRGDFLYSYLNFLVSYFHGSIYIVNVFLASLLVLSVYLYSSLLSQRFITLLISFPYIFVVVGMGFNRQGMALSLILIGLYYLQKNKYFIFILYSAFSIFSHKSAIIILAISFFKFNKYFFLRIISTFLVALLTIYFVKDDLTRSYFYYVGEGVHLDSKGSVFRNFFNTIPVLILIIFYKRFLRIMTEEEKQIYLFFSFYQLILLIMSFYISTFADRMTIYSLPLQLFIFSNLHSVFNPKYKIFINIIILSMYNCYFFIWIYLGQYSKVWFPYRNIIIEYILNFPVK